MLKLSNLPKGHVLRNTPLKDIKAKYRWKWAPPSSPWRTVEVGSPKLVNNTYNELGNSWTEFDDWVVDEPL